MSDRLWVISCTDGSMVEVWSTGPGTGDVEARVIEPLVVQEGIVVIPEGGDTGGWANDGAKAAA